MIDRSHSHLTILKRKQRKKVLHEFSQLFNEGYKKEAWIEYLIVQSSRKNSFNRKKK